LKVLIPDLASYRHLIRQLDRFERLDLRRKSSLRAVIKLGSIDFCTSGKEICPEIGNFLCYEDLNSGHTKLVENE
jgi:hypothetical protein